MSRYIAEYTFTTAGGKLTVPRSTRFLGVTKVGSSFVLSTEVWGDTDDVVDIYIKVFHKNEYMLEEACYLGSVLAGLTLFHFSYTSTEVLDRGGDGGYAPALEKACQS